MKASRDQGILARSPPPLLGHSSLSAEHYLMAATPCLNHHHRCCWNLHPHPHPSSHDVRYIRGDERNRAKFEGVGPQARNFDVNAKSESCHASADRGFRDGCRPLTERLDLRSSACAIENVRFPLSSRHCMARDFGWRCLFCIGGMSKSDRFDDY